MSTEFLNKVKHRIKTQGGWNTEKKPNPRTYPQERTWVVIDGGQRFAVIADSYENAEKKLKQQLA